MYPLQHSAQGFACSRQLLGSGNVPGLCLRRARLESAFPVTSNVVGDSVTSSVNKKLKETKKVIFISKICENGVAYVLISLGMFIVSYMISLGIWSRKEF